MVKVKSNAALMQRWLVPLSNIGPLQQLAADGLCQVHGAVVIMSLEVGVTEWALSSVGHQGNGSSIVRA